MWCKVTPATLSMTHHYDSSLVVWCKVTPATRVPCLIVVPIRQLSNTWTTHALGGVPLPEQRTKCTCSAHEPRPSQQHGRTVKHAAPIFAPTLPYADPNTYMMMTSFVGMARAHTSQHKLTVVLALQQGADSREVMLVVLSAMRMSHEDES